MRPNWSHYHNAYTQYMDPLLRMPSYEHEPVVEDLPEDKDEEDE
jgi:hypothetical protein